MNPSSQHALPVTADPNAESGFMLIVVVVMVALVLLTLAIAAPVVARDLRRDKEVESQHRALEYERAIQLYYRKFKSYPPTLKALEGTNNVRYLRKQYDDPLTGKSDWRIIHLGEQKTKTRVFFGEELAGLTPGGLGSAAGLASSNGPTSIGGTAATTVGSTNALNAGFGGATIGGSAGSTGTTGATGATGSSSAFGNGTVGAIVGVGPAKSGDSISQPNQQTSYDAWEFWWDPRIEQLKQAVPITGGGVASQSASSFGVNATSGLPNGASGATGATTPTHP